MTHFRILLANHSETYEPIPLSNAEENTMKNGILAMALFAAALCAPAAFPGSGTAGDLSGEWEAREAIFFGHPGSVRIVFGPDAVATFHWKMAHSRTEESIQYRLEDGVLYFYPLGDAFDIDEAAEIPHSFIDGKLRLVLSDEMDPLLLDKLGQPPTPTPPASKPAIPKPPSPPPEPGPGSAGGSLEGKWESGDLPGGRRIAFEFLPSGTVRITAFRDGRSFVNEGSYSERETEIVIRARAGREMRVPKKWLGDRLSLTVEGEAITLSREGAAGGGDDDDNPWL